MTLEQAIRLTRQCSDQMEAGYQKVVFDEWIIVAVGDHNARLLMYRGPRKDGFERNLVEDVRPLREELFSREYNPGDFEFARQGAGTQFDAFMTVGEGIYLLCNNTSQTMDAITKDPLWLSAQVPFVELSDAFRQDPLRCLVAV